MADERSSDDRLDAQIARAFNDQPLRVDPNGSASAALLEQLLGESARSVHDDDDDDAISASIGSPVFGEDIIDEHRPAPESRSMLLVAAAVVLVSVLGIAAWAMRDDDGTSVLSDGLPAESDLPDEGAPSPDVADSGLALIVGAGEPLVTLVTDDLVGREDAVRACARQFGTDPIGALPAVGAGSLRNGLVLLGTDVAPEVIILDDGVATTRCSGGDETSSWGSSLLQGPSADNPVIVHTFGGTTAPHRSMSISGQLSPEVESLRLVNADVEDQSFRTLGSWFRIDGSLPSDASVDQAWTLEVSMVDGVMTTEGVAELADRELELTCGGDRDCVSLRISEALEAASMAGSAEQSEALADLVLTQAEYDSALESFENCALGRGIESQAIIGEDSLEGQIVRACHESEIAHIEIARRWQNHFVSIPMIERSTDTVGDETLDEPDAEVAAEIRNSATMAQSAVDAEVLFTGGISREELGQLWDGYPYGIDEKELQIERYQADFAWIQTSEIDIEVNFYLQFGNPEFFQPIVTARSMTDPTLAAVFVMGWNQAELSIARIPESTDPAGDQPLSNMWGRDSESITIPGVGVEGGVSAFVNGEPLETASDHETFTTKISIPEDLPLPAHVTIVSATPELPGAWVLWLQPFDEEPLVLSDDITECYAAGTRRVAEDVTLYQVEPNFDDENPGLDQETNTLLFFADAEPTVTVTTTSTWLDLDGDGVADTLQRLDIHDRLGSRKAEGYRVCGTSNPTRSLWNDPSEGPLIVLADTIEGVEWRDRVPRGGLIIGSDELAGVSPGQANHSPDQAWTFGDDGLLVRLSDALASE